MEGVKKTSKIYGSNVMLCVLLTAGIGIVYYPVFIGLMQDWSNNDNYSHGYFIPMVSCYMVYSLREQLTMSTIKPANWGLLLLIFGLAQLYIAQVGSELFLQRTSILPLILGMVLFLLGFGHAKLVFLPICYLIFMIPLPAIIWNKIAFPMQLFSSAVTERVVQLIGIPIFREGNILHLAQTTLEVVDACSGLRSLVTMFALSGALAWFTPLSPFRKGLLVLAAAPTAVIANMVRLTTTAVLASSYSEKVAQGFLHEMSGLFTFLFGFSLLLLFNWSLQVKRV